MGLFNVKKEIKIGKGIIKFLEKHLGRKPKFESNLCKSCVYEFDSKICPLYSDPKRNEKSKNCMIYQSKYKDE